MTNEKNDSTHERVVVAAIEHDRTRIWLLHNDDTKPLAVVTRPMSDLMHVRGGQERHLHASEANESKYFAAVAHELTLASHVILLGHGTGRSNTMDLFTRYAADHSPHLLPRLTSHAKVDFPSLTDGQIIAFARKLWLRQ